MAFYRGVSVAFIEGCPHVRCGLYRGVSSRSGVAFMRGFTEGVSIILHLNNCGVGNSLLRGYQSSIRDSMLHVVNLPWAL